MFLNHKALAKVEARKGGTATPLHLAAETVRDALAHEVTAALKEGNTVKANSLINTNAIDLLERYSKETT